jgi:hypothetical protein
MRRLFKIVFIMLVLCWGAASLRHAQGQRGGRHQAAADSGAALEIYDTGDKMAPTASRIERATKQTVTWAKDSEIEE